jgi:SAM-dependent methyltransferase
MLTHSLSVVQAKAKRLHLTCGTILELGPGRVWPGLAWLQREPDLDLTGLGYAEAERQEVLALAKKSGLLPRVHYPAGEAAKLPLKDRSVDGVISFGALHAWPKPMWVLDEIARVLKLGGKFFIGDVRRDMNWITSAVLSHVGQPGLQEVYRTRGRALTAPELQDLFTHSHLQDWKVEVLGSDVWVMSAG